MQQIVFIKLVLFSIIDNDLKIFLQNTSLPSKELGPGRGLDENVRDIFEANTKIDLKDQYAEQLYTVSLHKTIAIVYYILVPETDIIDTKAAWRPFNEISKNIPDYQIITYAVQRLQWKIEYTNIVYSLLPEEFTLSELQNIYGAIFGKEIDKRNFRKKILSLNFLIPTGKKKIGNSRPAHMYTFRERKPMIIHVFS